MTTRGSSQGSSCSVSGCRCEWPRSLPQPCAASLSTAARPPAQQHDARTGQVLAVAAVPPLVGLTGDALNVADQLDPFDAAMVVAAAPVASNGLISAVFLRWEDLVTTD